MKKLSLVFVSLYFVLMTSVYASANYSGNDNTRTKQKSISLKALANETNERIKRVKEEKAQTINEEIEKKKIEQQKILEYYNDAITKKKNSGKDEFETTASFKKRQAEEISSLKKKQKEAVGEYERAIESLNNEYSKISWDSLSGDFIIDNITLVYNVSSIQYNADKGVFDITLKLDTKNLRYDAFDNYNMIVDCVVSDSDSTIKYEKRIPNIEEAKQFKQSFKKAIISIPNCHVSRMHELRFIKGKTKEVTEFDAPSTVEVLLALGIYALGGTLVPTSVGGERTYTQTITPDEYKHCLLFKIDSYKKQNGSNFYEITDDDYLLRQNKDSFLSNLPLMIKEGSHNNLNQSNQQRQETGTIHRTTSSSDEDDINAIASYLASLSYPQEAVDVNKDVNSPDEGESGSAIERYLASLGEQKSQEEDTVRNNVLHRNTKAQQTLQNRNTETSHSKIKVGFSQVGAESDWRKASTESIKGEAAKRPNIDLTFSDAQQKQENQIKAIRNFISKGVDVISFSPVVATGFEDVLKEARNAGIPVVLFDRAVDVSEPGLYVSLIGSSFVEEGRQAARWLLENVGDKNVNIAEICGTSGSAPAIERKKGFEEIIRGRPGIKIVKSQDGDFTRSQGKRVMESFLRSPEGNIINVVFAHNDDMALGAIQAIEEVGKKPGKDIIIISIDGVKAMIKAILAGKANCTVECSPLIGAQLFDVVEKIHRGEPVPAYIPTKEEVFDHRNVTQGVVNSRKY